MSATASTSSKQTTPVAFFSHNEIVTFIEFVQEKDLYKYIDGKTVKNEHVYQQLGKLVTESKLFINSILIWGNLI